MIDLEILRLARQKSTIQECLDCKNSFGSKDLSKFRPWQFFLSKHKWNEYVSILTLLSYRLRANHSLQFKTLNWSKYWMFRLDMIFLNFIRIGLALLVSLYKIKCKLFSLRFLFSNSLESGRNAANSTIIKLQDEWLLVPKYID